MAKNKGGRKSKAEELRLSAIMDDIGNTEQVLRALYKRASTGMDMQATTLWLAYKYGKPKDNEGLPTEMRITIVDDSEY